MIGIFDSGSGGLTVLKAIRETLPSCDVVYFGDIKNAPYGSKSQEELLGLTLGGIRLLQEHGATKLVSACNSTSASMALSLLDSAGLPPAHVIEMVGPTVAYFKDSPQRVLLCATEATVRSGIYQNAFKLVGKDTTVLAIPSLAGAIEFGEKTVDIIASAFAHVNFEEFDVLVLACTHYPLVMEQFKKVVPQHVELFDPAVAVAERVAKQFWPQEVGDGTTSFLISKDSPHFRALLGKLFPAQTYSVEVVE